MNSSMTWKFVLFLWLYSGILRNLLPQLNYFLYLLPFFIAFFYFLAGRSTYEPAEKYRKSLLLFLILIFTFQTLHYLVQSIDLKGLFTGLILYGLAPTILFLGYNANPYTLLHPLIRSIEFAIPINLVVVFFQVVGNLKFFRYSPLTGGEAMTTDGSVLRAFGTFTHPTGFATFMSVASVVVIYQFESETNLKRFGQLFQLGLLYFLSGSRTVFINLALIMLTYFSLKIKNSRNHDRAWSSKILFGTVITFGLAFALLKLKYSWVLTSFSNRISAASAQENSLGRIFNQSFGWLQEVEKSLWGQGLSSFSTLTIGFAKDRSTWIEDDLAKNIAEAGSLLGIMIITLRWALPFVVLARVKRSQTEEPTLVYLLLAACFSNLVIGALTGQGSVALQVWICLTVCINMTSMTLSRQKRLNSS